MNDCLQAIRNAGYDTPDYVEPGRFYRFPGLGKGNGNSAGWCKLTDDRQAGFYGDHSTGLSECWFADKDISDTGRQMLRDRAKEEAQKAAKECEAAQQKAAKRAQEHWDASEDVTEHPYLTAKGVKPHGTRIHGDSLLIPVRDGSEIISLQKINPDGQKRFAKGGRVCGGYFGIGKPDKVIYLAEGFATGASIHEATGEAVAVAFNAGNLKAVAETLRARFPNVNVCIAADNDESETGQKKAREAGGEVHIPPEAGDWNDYHLNHGLEAVKKLLTEQKPVGLARFTINRSLDEMKQRLRDEKFVLEDVALQGQLTCFYARQNSGKTLITIRLLLDAVKSGRISAEDIFYINADDDPSNSTLKGEILDEAGIQAVVMHEQGFEPKDFLPSLREMELAGEAQSKIVVIDTVKKFVDLMSKNELSQVFNPGLKRFQSAGGTVIPMAHTNKQLVNGKPIHAGVTDILEDFDCSYTIDKVGEDGKTRTVEFDANPPQGKTRGSNKKIVQFCYELEPVNYRALLESVRKVSEFEAEDVKRQKAINDRLEANAEEIQTILECISAGFTRKTELTKEAASRSGTHKPKITKILGWHNGSDYKSGHRWKSYPGEAHTHLYRITRPRDAAEEYRKAKDGE